MWHPVIAHIESGTRINNAIHELEEALYQEDTLCFNMDQEKTSQIKLAMEILKGNRNDLI